MEALQIHTQDRDYSVVIGVNHLPELSRYIQASLPDCNHLLVFVDSEVYKNHWDKLEGALNSNYKVSYFIIPSGETSKSFSQYEACLTKGLEEGLNRKSAILAFGGGMVGDLSGFVAATYMRGIPFIQVPTTLLAHDSAVGGKVAINHPLGKNMVGAFYQPSLVFYDLSFLQTLPDEQWRSGYAELIKHAMLRDSNFVKELMNHIHRVEDLKNHPSLPRWVQEGIFVKKGIVEQDERELGVRAALNLGHTYAHALETFYEYKGISHGEAVGIGLLFTLELSEKLGFEGLSCADYYAHLKELGYNYNPQELDARILTESMLKDKKNESEKIRFVLLNEFGDFYFKEFTQKEVEGYVAEFLQSYSF